MPRPRALPRWIALAVVCAAIPPSALHAAVAAAAGTLFEAAPFVLAGGAAPLRLLRRLVPFAGCGCSRTPGSGALSLPATALCWLAFGPVAALARFAAGAALVTLRDRNVRVATDRNAPVESSEPLVEFQALAVQGFVFGLAVSLWQWSVSEPVVTATLRALGAYVPHARAAPAFAAPLLCFLAGAVAGRLAPCATAGVAVAVFLRSVSPAGAYGMLATAGLWPFRFGARRPVRACVDARPAYGALAVACTALVLRNGHGFVNPRLVPCVAVAAVACALALRYRPTTVARVPLAAPAFMFVALVLGSPLPIEVATANEATLADVYPGQRVAFVGRLAADRTRLVRYVISCCRADAAPVAVRLARPSVESPGVWLAAEGIALRDTRGFTLDYRRLRRIEPPSDPFAYR